MIINNNPSALSAYNYGAQNANKTAGTLGNLSSGQKINSGADDAAGLAISEKLRSLIGGLAQGTSNTYGGRDMLSVADGGLEGIHSNLQRMRELAVQASNGIYSDSDRSHLQSEFGQLSENITQVSSTTNYNGQHLLDGSMDDVTIHTGGQADQNMSISFADSSAAALGLGDVDISTASGAMDAIGKIDDAISQITSMRTDIGATTNRMDHGINNSMNTIENLTASESRIRDADMAKEIMDLSKSKIQNDINMFVKAQSNNITSNVLQLLR